MPVRFRCVYCNQLLGISRRKVGSVVRCTSCDGQIIVPEAEPAMQLAGCPPKPASAREHAALPNDIFERNDIDALLRPFEFDNAEPNPETPPCPAPVAETLATRTMPPRQVALKHFVLALVATAAFAFIAGYIVGLGVNSP